jgi:hypothetical protein
MQSQAEIYAPGFMRCSSGIMSEGEGDEAHLATTAISGYKKCFTDWW